MQPSNDTPPPLDTLRRKIDEAIPKGADESQSSALRAQTGNAMRAGTDLLAGVGVGGVMGYLLDQAAGTSPVLLIVFFFLGFAAGVRNIIRSTGSLR